MEKMNEDKILKDFASATKMKEESASDIPADDIEENRDVHTGSDSSSSSSSDSDSDSEYECKVCKKSFSGYYPFRQHQKGKKHAKAVLKKKKEKKLLKKDIDAESDEEELVQEPYAKCKICNKEFYGPEAYEKHLKSKKHKQKALAASVLEEVLEDGKINVEKLQDMYKSKSIADDVLEHSEEKIRSLSLEDEEDKDEEFECKECEKIFSGLIPFTQHLISKSHAKRVEKKDLLHKVIPGASKEDEVSVKPEENAIGTLSVEDDILVCKICSTSFSGPENAITHMKSKKHAKVLEKYMRKLERRKEKKRTKSTDLSSDEKREVNAQDETTKIKLQPASDNSVGLEESDSCKNNSVQSSNSDTQVTEGLIAYEKYKEYKSLINSVLEDQLL